jgi:hypothetical protein
MPVETLVPFVVLIMLVAQVFIPDRRPTRRDTRTAGEIENSDGRTTNKDLSFSLWLAVIIAFAAVVTLACIVLTSNFPPPPPKPAWFPSPFRQ